MINTSRLFTSKNKAGEPVSLKFVRPNQSIVAKGELKAKEAFSKAFRGGVLVNSEVMKVLRERGIWDEEKDKEVLDIRRQILELEKTLENDTSLSNEDGEKVVLDIKQLRLKLATINSVYTTIVDNTCESLASEARNQLYAALCVADMKGNKVFKDFEDFTGRLDEQVALDSYREAVIAGLEESLNVELPSDLTSHYTENKWLKTRKTAKEEEEKVEPAEEEKPKKSKKTSG